MSKKVLTINTTFSTGGAASAARDLFNNLNSKGFDVYFAYSRGGKSNENKTFKFGSIIEVLIHAFLVRFLGLEGYGSYFSTCKLIKYIKKEKFDLIHLHNLHGYYLNFYTLIKFLNKSNIPIIWTLHDEWMLNPLLAHESYSYPKTYNKLFLNLFFGNKQKLFKNLDNLTIVSPAKWLAEKVKNSYLKDKNVIVISNGVNTDLFKPASDKIALRKKHGLPEDRKIILFPADKGAGYVLQAQNILKDKNYLFLGLSGVKDRQVVAELFALSDLFCITSCAETQPLVVLEAFSSGLPVVGFDIIALHELVIDDTGSLVTFGDLSALSSILSENLIEEVRINKSQNARNLAINNFSLNKFFEGYSNLYKNY